MTGWPCQLSQEANRTWQEQELNPQERIVIMNKCFLIIKVACVYLLGCPSIVK